MESRTSKDYWLVGTQFFLFFLFLIPFGFGFTVPQWLEIPSLIIAILGVLMVVIAIFNLDKSLTAFPTPKAGSQLITSGLYSFARHPIYTGVLLTVFGFSFYTASVARLLISLALLILFYIKTNYEEHKLSQKYPDYLQYKSKVGRFFPKF